MSDSYDESQLREHITDIKRAIQGLGKDLTIEIQHLDRRIGALSGHRHGSRTCDGRPATGPNEAGKDDRRGRPDPVAGLLHQPRIGTGAKLTAGAATAETVVKTAHRAKEGTQDLFAKAAGVKRTPMREWSAGTKTASAPGAPCARARIEPTGCAGRSARARIATSSRRAPIPRHGEVSRIDVESDERDLEARGGDGGGTDPDERIDPTVGTRNTCQPDTPLRQFQREPYAVGPVARPCAPTSGTAKTRCSPSGRFARPTPPRDVARILIRDPDREPMSGRIPGPGEVEDVTPGLRARNAGTREGFVGRQRESRESPLVRLVNR